MFKVHKVQAYTQPGQHEWSKCRGKGNRVVHLEKGEFRAWVIGSSSGERGRDGPHVVTPEGQLEGTVWELTEDCRLHTGVGMK